MGLTTLRVEVGNPAKPKVTRTLRFLVDSGVIYSVVPTAVLRELRIKPLAEEELDLADGSTIVRKRGGAMFRYGDLLGVADVIFGEEGDSVLFGVTARESLGLVLDPIRRVLRRLPKILGGPIEPRRP